ncbi:TPA: hypothetical protein N0H64_000661 [Pseudomonas aeruginosa]|nr:helix-turn-helix transcriptional regulator [Pseudomonas aeruginosa]HCK4901679.1 hypothetical protein [Pseudomonas aeruginosa]
MSELNVHARTCEIERMVQNIEKIRSGFVARLREAAAQAGLKGWGLGKRLAEVAEVTPKASSKWLNLESMPDRVTMLRLADFLKVRVEWLEHGEGEMRAGATAAVAEPQSKTAPSINMDALLKLKNKATPRSLDVLRRIEKAAIEGRLKEADMIALDGIATRLEQLNTEKP